MVLLCVQPGALHDFLVPRREGVDRDLFTKMATGGEKRGDSTISSVAETIESSGDATITIESSGESSGDAFTFDDEDNEEEWEESIFSEVWPPSPRSETLTTTTSTPTPRALPSTPSPKVTVHVHNSPPAVIKQQWDNPLKMSNFLADLFVYVGIALLMFGGGYVVFSLVYICSMTVGRRSNEQGATQGGSTPPEEAVEMAVITP